ncbi:MAG TPA: GAF domain-containing protein [Blastocatellia bacterium]|nr:GAF domain-containing protein [Blastocatellia bacterium]
MDIEIGGRKSIEDSLREQTEIIETINRVGQTLSAELDLKKLVQALTDAATELTGARFGSYFYNVFDSRGASYMLYTLSGVPIEHFIHFPMPRATDMFGPTFRGEGVIRIADVRQDPRYGKNSPYYGIPPGHLPVVSYLAVPVISRSGEVLGGLFFGHPDEDVFTERHESIVVGLAAQAAIAIDNARLFDAAQRERAQAKASEERYRFLAEQVPEIVWTAGPDGYLDYYNRRWYEYTGKSFEESEGWAWQAVVHPDDVEMCLERWTHSVETGEDYKIEFRMRRASDGDYRWHLARAVPLRDEDGEIIKWFGTATDIDDQKRSEESLRFLAEASAVLSSSLSYEATLTSMAQLSVPRIADYCVVDIINDQGQIERLAVAHFDPKKVELVEELQRRYPPEANRPGPLTRVLQSGRSELVSEIPDPLLVSLARDEEHLRIMRELKPRSFMVVPLVARGRTLGAISFVSAESGHRYDEDDLALAEDLARRAALAVDNARLYRETQEASRLKDDFLATVSHELRTPLNAILGWSRMLRTNRFDDETAAQALETIERNARAQAQLIEDLLDVSRIITGKLRLDIRPVEPVEVINAAIDAVRPAADAKQVRIQTVLDPWAGVVSGDPDRLQQVLWNLLSNAIKFTPKEGSVQIRLERVNSHIDITLSDTGQGIAPEFLPFVFDRFRQADSTLTRAHGGLGLGLAIVRHLVEMHGGTVRAESEGEGRGATFTVKLPLRAIHHQEPEAADPQHVETNVRAADMAFDCPPDLKGVRIMVVDDEEDARRLLVAVLEQCAASVRTSASVAEALAEIKEWEPDVLVSDIEMPGEDGYMLIRKVRELESELGRKLPAVALTAHARAEDRMRVLSSGYQMHVPKPVEPAELAVVIASLAGRAAGG